MDEEKYFYALRAIARKQTLDELNERIRRDGGAATWDHTELASVSDEAVDYADNVWPQHYRHDTHPGFCKPWVQIVAQSRLQPSRFEIAVWQTVGGVRALQGMATGTRSSGNEHLTLNWVERNFGPEYTRFGVLMPILSSFENYARLLGVQRVLIKNPIDPSKYERYGYLRVSVKSPTLFFGKEMNDG